MKEIRAAIAAPIRYSVSDPETGEEILAFTMLGDAPGIMRWLVPARVSEGMPLAAPLTADTFDEFLSCVVAPADAGRVAAAIEDGTFGDKARFDAATQGWVNAQFLEVRSLAKEMLELSAKVAELRARIAEAEAEADDEVEDPVGEVPEGAPLGRG